MAAEIYPSSIRTPCSTCARTAGCSSRTCRASSSSTNARANAKCLARQPGVPGPDRTVAQLRGGLLDHLPVGPVDLDPASVVLVRHVLLPVVALLVGARGKRARSA